MTLVDDFRGYWRRFGVAIVCYVLFLACIAGAESLTRYVVEKYALRKMDGSEFVVYRLFLTLGFLLYGAWRATRDNPALHADYGNWLQTSPWTPEKPLPLGPVRLQKFDVVLICLGIWAWPSKDFLWVVPVAFSLPYSGTLGILNGLVELFTRSVRKTREKRIPPTY